MKAKPLTIKVLFLCLIGLSIPVGINSASAATPHLNLCTSGNYVLLGSSIINGASATISSTSSGSVGSASSAELLALVPNEIGAVNQSDNNKYLDAMWNLRKALDEARILWISGVNLVTGELSNDLAPGQSNLGTYTPGVYRSATAINIVANGVITLDGLGQTNPNFYFIAGTYLTVGAGATIRLMNGASLKNVYWVTGSISGDMTLGAGSTMPGNFLASGAATLGAGVSLTGRLLAGGVITLGANSHILDAGADTSCAPRMASVPEITTKLKAAAEGLIVVDFKVGQVTYTSVGANVNNNGTVASYTPTGTVAAGTPIDYVLYQYTAPIAPTLSLAFTDITLVDAKAGDVYSDNIQAKTYSDQLLNGAAVTYSLTGTLPAGLSFNSATGFVSGTVARDASVGTYNYVVTASAVGGYTAINSAIRLVVLEASAVLSIGFTDITLVDGRAGSPYSDFVAAKTMIGASDSGRIVAFSVSGTIPAGLTFSQTSGYLTGTIATSTTARSYPLTFTASSAGYTDVSITLILNVAAASTPSAELGIIFTDITLVDGRAGDSYSDNVVAKTTLGGIYVGAIVNYVMSGTAPQGLTFSQSSGYMTGTIASNAAIGDYSLTFTASSLGYTSQSLTTSLRVTAAASSTNPAVLGIIFTDITLVDGRAGDPYSDYVQAKGTSGGAYSTVAINYVLTGTLPLGLTFNPLNGYITGTISKDAIVGTYNIVVTAFAPGYPSQNLPFTFRVAAAPVITVIPSVIPAAPKTIVFTDTTLVNGYVGRSYADYVKANAFIGSVSNNDKVTYSLTGILPEGLSFSGSTGYVMGTVAKNATVGIYKVTVSAFASGYTTQQLIYELTVRATAVPTPSKTATPDPTPTSAVATKMILMDTIWFDSGKSLLTSSSKVALNTMIKTLVASPFKTVAINGFTDAVKGQPHTALSLARAKAVHSYILARTTGMKISSKGLGLAPSSANSSKSLQQSRKAEIWVG